MSKRHKHQHIQSLSLHSLRLLLSDAMNVTSSKNHLTRGHHHHLSLREHLLEHLLSHSILLHAEARRDNRSIGKVEVHVGSRQALILLTLNRSLLLGETVELLRSTDDVAGNIQLVDLEVATLGVGHALQQLVGILADGVLGILLVVRPGKKNLSRASEHAEIVHMAVGIYITVETVGQPENLLHAQTALELSLNLLLGHIGVAVGIQKTLLRGQKSSLTIKRDGASLQNHGVLIALSTLNIADLASHQKIVFPEVVATSVQTTPRVEGPVSSTNNTLLVLDEDSSYTSQKTYSRSTREVHTSVTEPGIIHRHFHHTNVLVQEGASDRVQFLRSTDGHGLKTSNGVSNVSKDLLSRSSVLSPNIGSLQCDK